MNRVDVYDFSQGHCARPDPEIGMCGEHGGGRAAVLPRQDPDGDGAR